MPRGFSFRQARDPEISNMKAGHLGKVPPEDLANLKASHMKHIQPDAMRGLRPEQMEKIPPETMAGFRSQHFEKTPPEAMSGLQVPQAESILPDAMSGFKAAHIAPVMKRNVKPKVRLGSKSQLVENTPRWPMVRSDDSSARCILLSGKKLRIRLCQSTRERRSQAFKVTSPATMFMPQKLRLNQVSCPSPNCMPIQMPPKTNAAKLEAAERPARPIRAAPSAERKTAPSGSPGRL